MSDPFDLTGHVSVVTGGTSGIGLGMARGLARAGARVYVWGTNEERIASATEELREYGEASAMRVDIADETAVTDAMATVAAEAGRLDSCFANAGIGAGRKALTETTLEDFHAITRVNLDGTFVTLREAARHMVAAGNGGSLVATSSLSARQGQAGGYAYTASKGALISIVKALAVELARHGIRANAILPGWVESNITTPGAFANEKFVANVMPRMPLRRWGTNEDFEAIAVYLASPASAFHTGDSILLDGGYAQF